MIEELEEINQEILEEEGQHQMDLLGDLYHLNKTLVEQQEKIISPYKLLEKKKIISNFINKTNNYYYMLLCNERKDYTLFHINNICDDKKAIELSNCLVDECLANRGDIKSIEVTNDKQAVEIWISIENESFVYYFFPYDAALVEI